MIEEEVVVLEELLLQIVVEILDEMGLLRTGEELGLNMQMLWGPQ